VEIGHLRLSSAWEGGSILKRPMSRSLQARGFFPTYDMGPNPRPAIAQKGLEKYAAKRDQPKQQQDNVVVLEALQRLLRKEPDKIKPFSEIGQARPLR